MFAYAAPVFVASIALFGASPVAAANATDVDVAIVTAQFSGAHIVPDVLPAFKPTGLVSLNFAGAAGVITVGQAIPKTSVAAKPEAKISGTPEATAASGSPFSVATTKYTALMMDGNYVGSSNPSGYNLHYLENDLTYGAVTDGSITLADSTAGPTIKYAGPGPAAGSGPHRYIWLVYPQPANFTVPATPAKGGSVALFDLAKYKTASNLGSAIAGTYFTVEEGTGTVSVGPTSSVDTSAVAASLTATHSGSSAAASASASGTTKPNGASKTAVGTGAGVIALALGAIFSF